MMKKMIKIIFGVFVYLSIGCVVFAENCVENCVAQIGDVKYSTFDEAINAAAENSKIDLLDDISDIIIDEEKKVILDLKGHTIETLENSGDLTLRGEGKLTNVGGLLPTRIVNEQGAILTINNVSMITKSDEFFIENNGELIIETGSFSYEEVEKDKSQYVRNNLGAKTTIKNIEFNGGVLFENKAEMVIKNGTFNLTQGNDNFGNLTIDDGNYNCEFPDYMITNTRGTLTINGGTYNMKSIVRNYDDSFLNNNEKEYSKIIINNGMFNVSSVAFINTTFADYATIKMNGGEIISTSEDCVIQESNGSENNTIHIIGGKITAENSVGLCNYGDTDFVIGTNDGEVSTNSPIINIKKGNLGGLGVPKFKFYDGKIQIKEQISNDIKLIIQEEYFVKYDKNDDLSYTAYLTSLANKTPLEQEDKDDKFDNLESNESEKNEITNGESNNNEIKNPTTGIALKYGLFILMGLIGCLSYLLIRKQSKFPKHN